MEIIKRVKLDNNTYFIKCDCHYESKNNETRLCLNNYSNDYFDSGDLSVLIKKIESKYSNEILKKYDNDIVFLASALYIYNHIPFISGVGDYYTDKDGNIYAIDYINKEELDEYIEMHHINMQNNSNFKLWDERTWII